MPNRDHYKPFSEVYGTQTSGVHLPSLREKEGKGHQLPFNPSAQTAKNTGLKVTCVNCFKSRLLHSQRKLKPDDVWWLDSLLEDMSCSRGSSIQEMDGDR